MIRSEENLLFEQIMSGEKSGFLYDFEIEWANHLSKFDSKFSTSHQMKTGHRLRPVLVAWGYSMGLEQKEIQFSFIMPIAISIEMIHKASIIIDDFVDEDDSRHSLPTFHVEHTSYEAILFAVQLLSYSFKLLSEHSKMYERTQTVGVLAETVFDMSQGALKELQLGQNGLSSLKELNEVIHYQTVGLIKNSLLLGFLNSDSTGANLDGNVSAIGNYLGYVFQMLNDVEPFSHAQKNAVYKGNQNYDFNKSRKNIVIGYLLGLATVSERQRLLKGAEYDFIMELYNKYKVENICLNEAQNIQKHIFEEMKNIMKENEQYSTWVASFSRFVHYVFKYCKERL